MPAASGRVELAFPTPRAAQDAEASLRPDNGAHLRSRVEGHTLVLEAEADSAMGVLRSLDDALACLRATGLE